nr:mannonate dehydratase [Kiritimatiellia bacterium]
WRYETLSSIVSRLKSAGLNVVGLEGDPFEMTPIKEYGEQGKGNGEREETIAHYRELLESMGRLGIKLLCYNFMVGKGWSRTGVREGRGGAKATYFSLKEFSTGLTGLSGLSGALPQTPNNPVNLVNPVKDNGLVISHDQVWANYEYFIRAVMPTAEKCSVRMALHPDDPCLSSFDGYARIFGSVEAYDRAYALYPSPSNAVTFCQANFKLMGVDLDETARHFGKRIAFIHVRDVEGTKEDFTELFHDQGDTEQFALMRTYREIGLDVPIRGDHVPEMAYDRELTPEGTPGYFTLGRLFANGYLKALMKGTDWKSECGDQT